MLKTFKKSIALFVALVFVMSLVPFGVMAEVTDENVVSNFMKFQNWAHTRNNNSTPGPFTNADIKNHYAVQIRNDSTSNDRRAYAQLDLAGYEEILGNENTEISIRVTSGSSSSTYSIKDFNLYAMNDTTDFYATEYDSAATPLYEGDTGIRMSFTNAKNAGLHSYDAKGVLIHVKSDGTSTDDYPFDVKPKDIESMLRTGKDNSIVTFSFKSTDETSYKSKAAYLCHTMETFGTTIKYDKTKIDNQAYVNALSEEFSWADISDQDINAVENNLTLPTKYRGADITWTTTNANIVDSNGTITYGKGAQSATLTATFSYKGIEETAETATATAEFTVTPAMEEAITVQIPFTNYGNARSDKTTSQGYSKNSSNSNIHYITTGGIWRSYAQLDLSGYEEILNNENTSAELRIVSGNGFTSYSYDYKVYMPADSVDSYKYNTIYYDMAGDIGMFDANRPLLCERVDSSAVAHPNVMTLEADMESLVSVLGESGTNGLVTLSFAPGASGKSSVFRINHASGGLFITYYASEMDEEGYINDIEDEFAWELLTSDPQTELVNDLPTYFRGADITWSANVDGVVSADGKVSQYIGRENKIELTATVEFKGLSFTKTFDVTVPEEELKSVVVPLHSSTYITKNAASSPQGSYNTSYYSRYMYPVGLYGDGNDRLTFLKWDFAGNLDKLYAARSMSMNIKSVSNYTQDGGNSKLSVLPDGYEDWAEADLTYDIAVDKGMYTDPALYTHTIPKLTPECEITSSGEFLNAIRQSIADNPDDSVVNFRWEATAQSVTAYRLSSNNKNNFTITLYYYESELESAASKVADMPWSFVSSQPIDSVVASLTLPATFYGEAVTWTSSDESVITSSGEVIVGETDKTVKLTATVNGATKAFDVTVPANVDYVLKSEKSNYANAFVWAKEASENTTLVVASYFDGELVGVDVRENVALNKGENFVWTKVYSGDADMTVKVMILNNMNEITPLVAAK